MGFVFWHFDLYLDEAELIADGDGGEEQILRRAQDFFNVLVMQAVCDNCDTISLPTELGKL